MKSKFIKKAGAMAMAVAMAAMTVIGASAETGKDTIDTTAKTSLTIYKYDETAAKQAGVDTSKFTADGEKDSDAETALADYALQGVEFTYVKVGDINTDSQAGTLKLLYDLPTNVEGVLGLSKADHKYTSDEINAALKTKLTDANTATKNALEGIAASGTAMTETNAQGMTTASDLAQGLYLVVETKVPEEVHTTTDPFFVSLPMTDATGDYWNYNVVVYPKNQTNNPTIDKLVAEPTNATYGDTATASEGDVLDYRVVSKLPSITSEATYLTDYTFVDTLSKGIKYNKDTTIAFYASDKLDDAKNGTGTPAATWDASSTNFTAEYDDTNNKMTVKMTAAGLEAINPTYTDYYMVVIYKATVQSDATVVLGDTGNPNTVELTYSRTNEDYDNTIKDKANVNTYGINLTKTFSGGTDGDMEKVQFVLYNETDKYYVTATGERGTYYVTDGTHADTEAKATVFSPADDGSMKINGLEADTYTLTEIHTSDGYSLLKEAMTIVINKTEDTITASKATVTGIDNPNADIIYTTGDRASATVDTIATNMSADDTSTNARVDMSVVNTHTFTLPQTGGLGSILFTLGGAAVVIIGITMVTKDRSKKNAQ